MILTRMKHSPRGTRSGPGGELQQEKNEPKCKALVAAVIRITSITTIPRIAPVCRATSVPRIARVVGKFGVILVRITSGHGHVIYTWCDRAVLLTLIAGNDCHAALAASRAGVRRVFNRSHEFVNIFLRQIHHVERGLIRFPLDLLFCVCSRRI